MTVPLRPWALRQWGHLWDRSSPHLKRSLLWSFSRSFGRGTPWSRLRAAPFSLTWGFHSQCGSVSSLKKVSARFKVWSPIRLKTANIIFAQVRNQWTIQYDKYAHDDLRLMEWPLNHVMYSTLFFTHACWRKRRIFQERSWARARYHSPSSCEQSCQTFCRNLCAAAGKDDDLTTLISTTHLRGDSEI